MADPDDDLDDDLEDDLDDDLDDADDRSDGDDLPHALARPLPPLTWRERLGDIADSEMSPTRLVAALGAVAVAGVVTWRVLASPAPPPEMQLPMAEQAAPAVDPVAAAPEAAEGNAPPPPGPDGATAATVRPPADDAAHPATGTDGDIVVHVVGAVATPGVQRLPVGSRVVDAVEGAGGAAADADLGRINLAAALTDGQQVYVLRVGEEPHVPPVGTGTPGAPGVAGTGPDADAGGEALIDINTASSAQLEELPGVGPVTAEAIVDHREANGPFVTVDDLIGVRGIGEAKLAQVRDRVTV
jgi:competence protein ComEA